MARDRRLTIPSVLLVIIALTGGISLATLLIGMQIELKDQRDVFRQDHTWSASQVEREARVFRYHLLLYISGSETFSLDDVNRRFDVLWSRIENSSKGELGRLYLQVPGARSSLESGRIMLRKVEPLLKELKPRDFAAQDTILQLIDPFIDLTYRAAIKASEQTLGNQEDRRKSIENTGRYAIILVTVICLSGISLLVILLRNQYHLDQLTLNLEEKVKERTLDLEESNHQLKMLSQAIEQSPVSVVMCDLEGKIEYVNPKFVELTGYDLEEVIGRNPHFLQSGKTADKTYKEMWQAVHANRIWRGEICNRRKNGELFWENMSMSPIMDSGDAIAGYLAVKEDISQRKQYEEQLVRQANYDALTGLPNRTLAMDRLNQSILQAQRKGGSVALLFIDLDDFKLVNDTLGHECGDLLLKQAAQRFTDCLRDCDTAARFGGDEFLVILSELQKKEDIEPIVDRIIDTFMKPFEFGKDNFVATASIGVSFYPQDGLDKTQLLKYSDTAMYSAKKMGKNNYCCYSPELLVKKS